MGALPVSKISLDNICGSDENNIILFWAPRRAEIQRFVEVAKAVHQSGGKPKILDIGCGSGLLPYLLAITEEVDVIGMDPDEETLAKDTYSHPNLKFKVGDAEDAVVRYVNQVDVVLNSWMPGNLNLTPQIRRVNARAIIYIREAEATGVPEYTYDSYLYDEETGEETPNPVRRADVVSYDPGSSYRRAYGWWGPSNGDIITLSRRLKGDAYYGRVQDNNGIDIQIRRDIPLPQIPPIHIGDDQKYPWEKQMEQAGSYLENIERVEDW